MTPEKAQDIFKALQQHYPDARMILTWGNNFELLVAIILSAQCTDKKVNEVTEKLFPKYQNLKQDAKTTPERQEIINFAEIPLHELEQDIRPTGFYHNKAKSVQNAARTILEKYNGILPRSIKELITIPGVGRKTANVFLTNAYHINEGIAVDTHVKKQAKFLGLTKEINPDKIEQDLMQLFPQDQWHQLTYLLIEHGRNMRKKKADRHMCHNTNCILHDNE